MLPRPLAQNRFSSTTPAPITGFTQAPMNVEPARRRREAVPVSGRRRAAGRGVGEVRPGHGDGVVDVQIADRYCAKRSY